jgi:Tfp pilus assembly protein FimV
MAALLLAIVAGFLPATALMATAPARADAATAARPPRPVVVGPGDTLWDLALAHVPARHDPMAYMVEVIALNDVKATALKPGMVLLLP